MANSLSGQSRILVVDDDEGIRDTLSIALERQGHNVSSASDAAEALDLISGTHFDLILLDVKLPGTTSGLDLLTKIRNQYSLLDIPVIMISGASNSDTVVTALQQGANDYLPKPVDMHTMRARVKIQLTLRRLKQLNDHILRSASHDLKKPVMLMLDVARQLQENCPPTTPISDDDHSSLKLLIESGEYMQRIIEELLGLNTTKDGRLPLSIKPTDLGALVRQAVVRNSDYAKSKEIALDLSFTSELPRIMADDLRIMQVLDNLIGNAIKFCPANSRVTVTTSRNEQSLLCEIRDTGPGIAEGDMDKLFVGNAQLKNRPTGKENSTGLGLAICKELVGLHHGEIGARNNPDTGVTFWFTLPLE